MSTFESQIARIADRDHLHKIVDELGDDSIAMFVAQRKPNSAENDLYMGTYGDARASQILGLIGFAQVMAAHKFFPEDDT